MQQNEQNGALVPFTAYQAQAIQELDAEYSMWVEIVDRHTDEMQRLRDDFEKLRNGIMTLLTKLERQEGIISQLQLELQSYRMAAHKLDLAAQKQEICAQKDDTTRHTTYDTTDVQNASVADGLPVASRRKVASDVKAGEVIRHHEQYPQQSQFEVAKHFNITVRTLQRYFVRAGIEWKVA